MAFSYGGGSNPPIDYPRLLISDTVQFNAAGQRVYAFDDSEIMAATAIELAVWQSSMFFSPPAGVQSLGNAPVPWRRIAATLLDSLAANQARLQIIAKILDVTLNPGSSAAMREQAAALREADDNSGAFVVIEMVTDQFSFRDRWWKQMERQTAGGVLS